MSAGLAATLRGTGVSGGARYWASQYLSLNPNRVMLKSTLAATPAGATGYASLTLGTVTEGSTDNVAVGMLVLVGTADDPRAATWRGRVRAAISGSTLYVNETSAPLASGQYVWVIEDYPVVEKLARDDGAGNYYKDYAVSFRELLPQVYGLQHAYAGFVDATSGYFRIAFSVSKYATTSGGATPTVAWTFPAGAQIVSGGTNQAAVTVDFPASAGDWCSLAVAEGGRTNTVHFIVFPHNRTGYPPALGFSGASIEGSADTGWSATVEAWDGVADVLDQTLCCVWDEEWHNGTRGALFAAVAPGYEVKFVGRFRAETDTTAADLTYALNTSVRYTIEGLGAQLARIVAPLVAMRDDATPTAWDEINALTPWREIVHVLAEHSTALETTSINFDSIADTYREQKVATQSGSLLAACNTLAEGINAHLVFSPQGEIYVARDARYLTTSQRNALTVVANFTSADWLDYTLEIDHTQAYGRLTADGGTYWPAASIVYPYLAVAPGIAPDGGASEGNLSRQVLQNSLAAGAAKQELGDRAGDHWARLNTSTRLTVTHPDAYGALLVPRLDAWYTFTIAASENTGGRAYTTDDRWLLTRVSIEHDNTTGAKAVRAVYELETDGPRGVAYEPPAGNAEDDYLPVFPGFDPYDGLGGDFYWVEPDAGLDDVPPVGSDPNVAGKVVSDGNFVVVTDGTGVYRTSKFITGGANPPWEDITPPSSSVIAGLALDHTRSDGTVGLYVLGNDETNSYVDYLADVTGNAADYARGDSYEGIYTSVRVMDAPGQVEIYGPSVAGIGGGEGMQTITFEAGGYSNYNLDQGTITTPGYNSTHSLLGTSNGSYLEARVTITFSNDKTITALSCMSRLGTEPIGSQSVWPYFSEYDADDVLIRTRTNPAGHDFNWRGTSIGSLTDTGVRKLVIGFNGVGAAPPWLDDISWTTTTPDPLVAQVLYSDDYGATFTADQLTSPGSVGGFDCARLGDVTFAASDEQAYKTLSKGGAFVTAGADGATADAQPVLLMYPWYVRSSTNVKNFSTATPDYVLGASALVSGECLWWVAGAGGRTDITPSGATAAAGPDCVAAYYGTKLAAIMLVSTTPTLFTSTDGGATWSNRGALATGSAYVRFRRVGGNGNQVYAADGANIKYAGNAHAASPSWVTKTGPTTNAIVALEPWG